MSTKVVSFVFVLSLNLFLGACDRRRPQPAPQPRETIIVSPPPAPPAPAPAPPPVLPPEGDHDGDGIRNDADQCVTVPMGEHSDPTRAGCPAGDRDNDGVYDHEDECPGVASTRDNDPDGDGCPNPSLDAGLEPDAETDADTAPDAEAAADLDASPPAEATVIETDASAGEVADASSLVDAGNVIETDAGVSPTPPTDASTSTEDLMGLPVGEFIEAGGGRELANLFCWATSDQVRGANATSPNAPCGYGEVGCWRRASAAVTLPIPARGTTGTFGCLANSPLRWRCGVEVAPCTPATAAVAWRLHTPPQRTRR